MTKKVNPQKHAPLAGQTEDDVALAVSRRVSALRRDLNLTFDALAARSGVSKGTLVQLEQQRANPSIGTLCRLASALGVSVAELVAPAGTQQAAVVITPARQARVLWQGSRGGTAELLAGSSGPDMLELWRWLMQPGERFEAQRHGRGTCEIIHVTDGRLTLTVDGEDTIVPAGTTVLAHTDRPHAYANDGKTQLRFFMTVQEPASAP